MFITHRDNTLHLLDFSDKAGQYHNSRIPWIKNKKGSDSDRHQRAPTTWTKTHPREKHHDLHAQEQSLLTPANRKVLDMVKQGWQDNFQFSQRTWQISAFLAVNTDQLFPSIPRFCYSAEKRKFSGVSRMTSAQQQKSNLTSGVRFSISRRACENTAQPCSLRAEAVLTTADFLTLKSLNQKRISST